MKREWLMSGMEWAVLSSLLSSLYLINPVVAQCDNTVGIRLHPVGDIYAIEHRLIDLYCILPSTPFSSTANSPSSPPLPSAHPLTSSVPSGTIDPSLVLADPPSPSNQEGNAHSVGEKRATGKNPAEEIPSSGENSSAEISSGVGAATLGGRITTHPPPGAASFGFRITGVGRNEFVEGVEVNNTHRILKHRVDSSYNGSHVECYLRSNHSVCWGAVIRVLKPITVTILRAEVYNWVNLTFTWNSSYLDKCTAFYKTKRLNDTYQNCAILSKETIHSGLDVYKCKVPDIHKKVGVDDDRIYVKVSCVLSQLPDFETERMKEDERIYSMNSIVRPGPVTNLNLSGRSKGSTHLMIAFRPPVPNKPMDYYISLACPYRNYTKIVEITPTKSSEMGGEIVQTMYPPAYTVCNVSVRCKPSCRGEWSDWKNDTYNTTQLEPVSSPHISSAVFDEIESNGDTRTVVFYFQPMTDEEARGRVTMYRIDCLDYSKRPPRKSIIQEFLPPVPENPSKLHYVAVGNLSARHQLSCMIYARTVGYNYSLDLDAVHVPASGELLEISEPVVVLNDSQSLSSNTSQAVLFWTVTDDTFSYTAVWCLARSSSDAAVFTTSSASTVAAIAYDTATTANDERSTDGRMCKSVLMWKELETEDITLTGFTGTRHRRSLSPHRLASYSIPLPSDSDNARYLFGLAAENKRGLTSGIKWANRIFCYNQVPERPMLSKLKVDRTEVVISITVRGHLSDCSAPVNAIKLYWSALDTESGNLIPEGDMTKRVFLLEDFLSPGRNVQLTLDELEEEKLYVIYARSLSDVKRSDTSKKLEITTTGPVLKPAHIGTIVLVSIFVIVVLGAGLYAVYRCFKRRWKILTKLNVHLPEHAALDPEHRYDTDPCGVGQPNCVDMDEGRAALNEGSGLLGKHSLDEHQRKISKAHHEQTPGRVSFPTLRFPHSNLERNDFHRQGNFSHTADPTGNSSALAPVFIEMNKTPSSSDASLAHAVLPPANDIPSYNRSSTKPRYENSWEGSQQLQESIFGASPRRVSREMVRERRASLPDLNEERIRGSLISQSSSSISNVSEEGQMSISSYHISEGNILPDVMVLRGNGQKPCSEQTFQVGFPVDCDVAGARKTSCKLEQPSQHGVLKDSRNLEPAFPHYMNRPKESKSSPGVLPEKSGDSRKILGRRNSETTRGETRGNVMAVMVMNDNNKIWKNGSMEGVMANTEEVKESLLPPSNIGSSKEAKKSQHEATENSNMPLLGPSLQPSKKKKKERDVYLKGSEWKDVTFEICKERDCELLDHDMSHVKLLDHGSSRNPHKSKDATMEGNEMIESIEIEDNNSTKQMYNNNHSLAKQKYNPQEPNFMIRETLPEQTRIKASDYSMPKPETETKRNSSPILEPVEVNVRNKSEKMSDFPNNTKILEPSGVNQYNASNRKDNTGDHFHIVEPSVYNVPSTCTEKVHFVNSSPILEPLHIKPFNQSDDGGDLKHSSDYILESSKNGPSGSQGQCIYGPSNILEPASESHSQLHSLSHILQPGCENGQSSTSHGKLHGSANQGPSQSVNPALILKPSCEKALDLSEASDSSNPEQSQSVNPSASMILWPNLCKPTKEQLVNPALILGPSNDRTHDLSGEGKGFIPDSPPILGPSCDLEIKSANEEHAQFPDSPPILEPSWVKSESKNSGETNPAENSFLGKTSDLKVKSYGDGYAKQRAEQNSKTSTEVDEYLNPDLESRAKPTSGLGNIQKLT